MFRLKAICLLVFFALFTQILSAQTEDDSTKLKNKKELPQVVVRKSNKEYTIQGTITDKKSGEALIGVNIFVETDKLRGTVTDFDGKYEIKANEGEVLVFTYVGYEDQRLAVTKSQTYDFKMGEAETTLDVVVISGSRKKEKLLDAPASIATVDAAAIQNKASTGISDIIKNVSGVQVQRTGVQGGQPSVRGFNGYFTSDVMSLTDYRVAKLPNTGLNMYSMLTTTDEDIERIEVLKGPAAALYGPNANNGVIHIFTKSPIDKQETRFYTAIGFRVRIKDTLNTINRDNPRFDYEKLKDRTLFTLGFYHADTIANKNPNVKLGYRISSKFFTGHDWRYSDLGDPSQVVHFMASSDSVYYYLPDGTIDPKNRGKAINNERDERILNGQIDSRFDIRIKEDFNIVMAGGVNVSNGLITSPVGAWQNKGWTYSWAQARFQWKDLFVQVYMNGNNSRNTYVVPVGGRYIDLSKMYSFQVQHAASLLKKRINLIYGFDGFWTRPDTKGTLNGKYEDKDNIDEYGVYLQGDFKLHPRFSVIAATRLDYNNAAKKLMVSPKVGIMYKPATGHNLRFTFNRAFKNPASAAYYVDVKQGEIPMGIEIRNVGTPRSGFHYTYNANPFYDGQVLPQYVSPYSNGYHDVGDLSYNQTAWQGILSAIRSQFSSQAGIDPNSPILPLMDMIVNQIIPQSIPGDMPQVVKNLSTAEQKFVSNQDKWKDIKDVKGLTPTMTYTYELGYKGLVGKMLGISCDVYRTDFKNYLAPVELLTPAVLFDADRMMDYLGPQISTNYNGLNDLVKLAMNMFLDNSEKFGGNKNGTASDEFVSLIRKAVENLPIGVITPNEAGGPNMLLVTRNIGDLTVYGIDFATQVYLPKGLSVMANYSFVDKDSVQVEGSTYGYVALNSPKHRVNAGVNWNGEKYGLNIGVRFNWSAGFPVLSGNFIGRTKPTHDMDLDISYTPKFLNDHFNVTATINNVYNKKQQYFVGAPYMGLMANMKFSYIF